MKKLIKRNIQCRDLRYIACMLHVKYIEWRVDKRLLLTQQTCVYAVSCCCMYICQAILTHSLILREFRRLRFCRPMSVYQLTEIAQCI
jgi:hypothetical protein